MIWLAAGLLVFSVLVAAEALVGFLRIGKLADVPERPSGPAPRVSIVVAARNEERKIESAMRSMLAQRYPDYEIVVVDDRSTDRTGPILDALAETEPRLRVIHLTELPDGWLGKNHALQSGADHAIGEWILFTDADVHLDPETLSRAIGYCEEKRVDHLAIAPELVLPGLLLEGFGVFFLYAFLSFAKPWRASDPKSWFFIGVGAFNLVRREAYRAVEGHRRIRLRPDDDLKLGKILKRAGFRQAALGGQRMIRVEWYHSLGEMIRGFEKNMFAGVEYSVVLSLAGGILQLLGGVAPLALLPFVSGPVAWLLLAQIGWSALVFALFARAIAVRPVVAVIYPVIVLLFVYILWRTMALNLIQGGIQWRGTFYSLRDLKANRI